MLNDPIVQEVLIDITHEEDAIIPIIECILNGITSDLDIAVETNTDLKIVRKVLYNLNDAGVVTYKRSKDPESPGDIYDWKFIQEKVFEIISSKYDKIYKEIEKSIKYEEENMFFICKNGHRYKFEKASEINFKCLKCGNSLDYQDNSKIILELLKEKDACAPMRKLKTK
jgi:transcription initiation factor TFIIE subunit alpha